MLQAFSVALRFLCGFCRYRSGYSYREAISVRGLSVDRSPTATKKGGWVKSFLPRISRICTEKDMSLVLILPWSQGHGVLGCPAGRDERLVFSAKIRAIRG